MNPCEEITVPADLKFLHDIQEFICSHAGAMRLRADDIEQMELAVEEAFVNIVKHGYGTDEGKIVVSCAQHDNPAAFVITLKDNAPPFDPTQYSGSRVGRGLALMTACTDRAEYRREGNCNILVLTKV